MRITHEGTEYDVDEELSFKVFTNWDMREHPEIDLQGKIIYASCFYNEIPDSEVLPPELKGATFIKCNLDNVIIPADNTVIDCSQQRVEEQNDMRDWVIDESGNAQKVLNEEYWIEQGVSVDALAIPKKPIIIKDGADPIKAIKEAVDAAAIEIGIVDISPIEEVKP